MPFILGTLRPSSVCGLVPSQTDNLYDRHNAPDGILSFGEHGLVSRHDILQWLSLLTERGVHPQPGQSMPPSASKSSRAFSRRIRPSISSYRLQAHDTTARQSVISNGQAPYCYPIAFASLLPECHRIPERLHTVILRVFPHIWTIGDGGAGDKPKTPRWSMDDLPPLGHIPYPSESVSSYSPPVPPPTPTRAHSVLVQARRHPAAFANPPNRRMISDIGKMWPVPRLLSRKA
ncbi:hypothetical protein FB45DRAFT_1037159 [Roridomyces roridus]|uniref:Uncharacterized protein n=1 Tax=Roridomyces roridus TaxID=1738132 RepID=A0AAD7FAJ3_9AGAR|nr:hypothetical protein FB45DRAFT_1037159 [Roridomyces roridus]